METELYMLSFDNLTSLLLSGRFLQRNGWEHTGRKIKYNLLVHIEDGSCVFRIDKRKILLHKDELIIIPQNTFYRPHTNSFCKYSYFHFRGEIQNLSEKALNIPYSEKDINSLYTKHTSIYLPKKCKANSTINAYFDVVLDEMQNYTVGSSFRKNLAFFNAINHISITASLQHIDELSKKIEQYIYHNLHNELTLSNIAKHFGYTKQYIIQIFKKQYGITPTKYINYRRLDLSLTYLTETSLKVNEIAEKCGFHDANYFCRIFKVRFGLSPLGYRAKLNIN